MEGATERVDGEVRLAVLPTLAPTLLPRLLPALVKYFPELRVNAMERTTGNMVRDLERGDIDVGILVTPLPETWLRTRPVYMEPLLAYVHP
ncbi:MAG: LysR substrate-binding domain-containing protein, partial [Flavobacteriales bacterium]